MPEANEATWLPLHRLTAEQKMRRVGVEIEYTGITAQTSVELIQAYFGGNLEEKNSLEFAVVDTRLGKFKLELDADMMKSLAAKKAAKQTENTATDESLSDTAADLLIEAAKQFVPWEVVTPPIPFDQLSTLVPFINAMRKTGALGTRHALHHAFGVHLNPELPDHQPATIVKYLQAFFCLYEWIVKKEDIDTARKLSPYINHFGKDYILLVISPEYRPSLSELIDDYLRFNPTRNRSLDMLPLFTYLDEARVRGTVDDARVNGRPTFHYRLPNCDIDNPDWNITLPWFLWLEVEKLVVDEKKLAHLCTAFQQELARLSHPFENRWVDFLEQELTMNAT